MSRIGKNPVEIPSGVDVSKTADQITVKGPKGTLTQTLNPGIDVNVEDGQVVVSRPNETREARELHGLYRTLVANMVIGVTDGFSKKLEIVGVGYRAAAQGKGLKLQLGFSHDVVIDGIDGIEFEVPSQTEIVVKGISKQQVGQVAANIRKLRPPEPYKGKGVKYADETILRKAGKAAG
ncbi:50S ribosomal protein L6 [Euzebya pacifica]|jgi:large subunit ribosomal protein L6|uniref:50S ribosomal protein L6 n=1 Tax=Euzebya pacifica TaxID=1608957 RepID=UPI0030FCDCB5